MLRKCLKCGRYTMKPTCEECKVETRSSHPPKYSPDDKYRMYKARIMKNKYLLETLKL